VIVSTKETKLKIKRKETPLTQADLAKSARITVTSYQRYESGERIPKADTAKLIALALNSTVEELF
jgi:DNA-binding helix-turn-helix protein